MADAIRVRATVFESIRRTHVIQVDQRAYFAWLGNRANNDDRLHEFIIENDYWPEEFTDANRTDTEFWGLDLGSVEEIE